LPILTAQGIEKRKHVLSKHNNREKRGKKKGQLEEKIPIHIVGKRKTQQREKQEKKTKGPSILLI